MNVASKQSLTKLADVAKEAYESVLAGENPDQAVIKAARSHELTENWTGRVCELTNRLIAYDHMLTAPAEKRASDHPVVHPDKVMAEMFPAEPGRIEAKAASIAKPMPGETFRAKPNMAKAASAKSVEAKPFGGGNYSDSLTRLDLFRRKMARADELFHDDCYAMEERIRTALNKAANAIRYSRFSFKDIEERVAHEFSPDAIKVMDKIAERLTKVARFTGDPRIFTTDPWSRTPFAEVDQAILEVRQSAFDYQNRKAIHKAAKSILADINEGIKKAANANKSAGFAGDAVSGMLGMQLGGDTKKTQNVGTKEDIMTAGVDPASEQELDGIQGRHALATALADPVIHKHSKNLSKVMAAFNQISETTPKAALNSETLIPMLRSVLEGHDKSVFDIKQQQDIETALAGTQDPYISSK
jgi:hypothetical protein